MDEKEFDNIFEGVYSGEISIEVLPIILSEFTYQEIMNYVNKGIGKATTKLAKYGENISAFSGAKTFQQVKDMSLFVFDAEGVKRPFREFREFAQIINNEYNVNWLRTEQDTAFGISQSADKWLDIEGDKETFPLLRYITIGDDRVRADHAEWNGIVRPVDDSFWDTNMPPNAWNCRCDVEKLNSGEVSSLRGVEVNEDKMFAINPGKVDYIFNEQKHTYFEHTKAEGPAFKRAIKWQQ